MSSKRVWAVKGQYKPWFSAHKLGPIAESVAVEHDTIGAALEDVEYLWEAGFGSSMRSYVVPA